MKFLEALAQQFAGKPIDWDELEHALIRADLGVALATRIISKLQEREAWSLLGIQDVIKVAREEISEILPAKADPIQPISGRPNVILIVGVNGTGKTTSVAKLAHHLGRGGSPKPPAGDWGQLPLPARHRVLLAAADTFRAAAIEQLGVWAARLGVEMVQGQYGADPAALCYDAYQKAANAKLDFLICDTAGRLHTKSNLMAELQKVKRALAKNDPTAPHEILLVVDATTGGNALSQAREFHQALGLTGLIVTKLDGTGKGGIVVAIQDELKIPTRFIGTGENLADFAPFDAREFVAEMLAP
ncbi:MAG TPA: signaling recognition particle receptor family protein [Chthoniobacterales bacterium]|jgi:fused signal recognition particle receptor|nr:signaling recognition particle receptor family protein [Chthoniobacterales bacterium]